MTTTDHVTTPPEAPPPPHRRTGRWIEEWHPEDEQFWETTGRAVARRNLAWSIFAEHLGFSVRLIWSVSAVLLVQMGFAFTAQQLFLLVALPNLVGSLLRVPYTLGVPRFGGRNWTVVSALLLLVPTLTFGYAVVGRRPRADVRPDRPDRRPCARCRHVHVRARRRSTDGRGRLHRSSRRGDRRLPGRRGRLVRRPGHLGHVRAVGGCRRSSRIGRDWWPWSSSSRRCCRHDGRG